MRCLRYMFGLLVLCSSGCRITQGEKDSHLPYQYHPDRRIWIATGLQANCRVARFSRPYSYSLDFLPSLKENETILQIAYHLPEDKEMVKRMNSEARHDIMTAIRTWEHFPGVRRSISRSITNDTLRVRIIGSGLSCYDTFRKHTKVLEDSGLFFEFVEKNGP